VFVTKYLRPVFHRPGALTHCERLMADICVDLGAELHEFNGEAATFVDYFRRPWRYTAEHEVWSRSGGPADVRGAAGEVLAALWDAGGPRRRCARSRPEPPVTSGNDMSPVARGRRGPSAACRLLLWFAAGVVDGRFASRRGT
jgi:hypothetical protein